MLDCWQHQAVVRPSFSELMNGLTSDLAVMADYVVFNALSQSTATEVHVNLNACDDLDSLRTDDNINTEINNDDGTTDCTTYLSANEMDDLYLSDSPTADGGASSAEVKSGSTASGFIDFHTNAEDILVDTLNSAAEESSSTSHTDDITEIELHINTSAQSDIDVRGVTETDNNIGNGPDSEPCKLISPDLQARLVSPVPELTSVATDPEPKLIPPYTDSKPAVIDPEATLIAIDSEANTTDLNTDEHSDHNL